MHDRGYLRELSEDASEREGWADFADYCRLRYQGLREQAFGVLDLFIEQAILWPLAERIAFVVWVGEKRQAYRGQPDAVTPVPLFERLARPTLEAWTLAAPRDPWPLVWLARLSSGGEVWHAPPEPFLREALVRDPACEAAKIDLAKAVLSSVDFAQHQLPDSYVGDADEDRVALKEITALLLEADLETAAPLMSRAAVARRAAEAWLTR